MAYAPSENGQCDNTAPHILTLWPTIHMLAQTVKSELGFSSTPTNGSEESLVGFYAQLRAFSAFREGEVLQDISVRERTLAFCILALGPKPLAAPPLEIWEQLHQRVCVESDSDDLERIGEFVIAWGCGWGRIVDAKGEVWQRRWQTALMLFIRMVESSVHQTLKQLVSLEADDDFKLPQSEEIRLYANLIGLEIINDRCRCGNHSQAGKMRDGHVDCKCCRPEHRLSTWIPEKQRLRAFAAQAVRGNASESLMIGAFSTGALYPQLREDYGITVGRIEFRECHVCKTLYEGNRCANPECRQAFDPQQTRCFERHNWLFTPYDRGGRYTLIDRWHCPECDNLFSVGLEQCPRCHHARPTRRTQLWVYQLKKSTPDSEINRELESLA